MCACVGIMEGGCEAVVCLEAVKGGGSWRGQVQVYTDNSVLNVEVSVSGDQQLSAARPGLGQVVVSSKAVEFSATPVGGTGTASLGLTNPTVCTNVTRTGMYIVCILGSGESDPVAGHRGAVVLLLVSECGAAEPRADGHGGPQLPPGRCWPPLRRRVRVQPRGARRPGDPRHRGPGP